MLRGCCGAQESQHYLQLPLFTPCTCIYRLWLTASFPHSLPHFLHPCSPVTPSLYWFSFSLPAFSSFCPLCISPVAPPLYLQMASSLRKLGCDWSPVLAVAVSPPVAFVHLPSLRSSLAGPALPPSEPPSEPSSAPHCMPCWALETAGWGVSGFWLGWVGWGGRWLEWVAQLK